jgi:hypothetical protein
MQNQMTYAFTANQNESACSAACFRDIASVKTAIMFMMAVLVSAFTVLDGIISISVVIVISILLLGGIIITKQRNA